MEPTPEDEERTAHDMVAYGMAQIVFRFGAGGTTRPVLLLVDNLARSGNNGHPVPFEFTPPDWKRVRDLGETN
jgi:hypothetical protein